MAISDTVNGAGFLLAGLFVPVMALIMIGEGNMLSGLTEVYTEERHKFDITGDEPGSFLPFGVLFTGMIVNQIFFFAAVMVGAILSTFNSVLNSSATLFSQGIYRALINRNASGRQMVRSGRWCSVVLALSAMILAPLIDTTGSLYSYLQMINATFFGPMLAVILLGFAWKRASAFAAKLVLVVGPILFYLLVFALGPQIQSYLQNLFGISEEIHFLHFLGFVFVLMVILMMTISYFKPATTVYRAEWSRDVDIRPWRHARTMGILISLATIAFYVLLAQ